MPTRLHLFPITQNALNHLMLNPVTQAEIIQRIQRYAPSSQGDWDHATYIALGTQAKVTAYVQSIPLLNLASGSAYTRIVNADDWTIRQALAICGVPEPSGNLRAIVINDQDQQSVVLDQRMNTPPHTVSSDVKRQIR
ncbi:MAG: hypothetical protein C7B47_18165 [Sulfobacillus thermosulfidooxidans]|uniref:Uncharacterized protein n=1 Tax=Sulfobacillus thermosulfidooxidans TaxID=28034 RepID=A0A2T2WDF3_SULTH|nr:MAG: hypothetical protein C7B47_18165 [Sulfobacillus thermosulfidooxidans]